MSRAVITYKFKCTDFNGETYNKKEWVASDTKIVDSIPSPFEDVEEGWYIDKDKRIAYFYSKHIEERNELLEHISNIKPIDYYLDCLVMYDYTITDYDTEEECKNSLTDEKSEQKKLSIISHCLCEEGKTENCTDRRNRFKIDKLNTCIKANDKFSSVKVIEGPKPID